MRQDIDDGVVPQDADILAINLGSPEPAGDARRRRGLSPFPFTLERNAKLVIEYFAGEHGVDCGAGQGQVGIYIDGAAQAGTLVDRADQRQRRCTPHRDQPVPQRRRPHTLTVG